MSDLEEITALQTKARQSVDRVYLDYTTTEDKLPEQELKESVRLLVGNLQNPVL